MTEMEVTESTLIIRVKERDTPLQVLSQVWV